MRAIRENAAILLLIGIFAAVITTSLLVGWFTEEQLSCSTGETAVRVLDPGPPAHQGPQVCVREEVLNP